VARVEIDRRARFGEHDVVDLLTNKREALVKLSPLVLALIALTLAVVTRASGAPVTQPATMTVPVVAETPTAVFHQLLRSVDSGDRNAVLACRNRADPKEAKIAELNADMMLAVARLKKAVRAKFGDTAPFGLGMAVVGEDECGPIKEEVQQDGTASVDIASIDETAAHRHYSMVRVDGHWKLSVADELKLQPANVPFGAELAAGKSLVANITAAAGAVEKGQPHSTDDVQRRISESMAGP
jgi:hypothetical protein